MYDGDLIYLAVVGIVWFAILAWMAWAPARYEAKLWRRSARGGVEQTKLSCYFGAVGCDGFTCSQCVALYERARARGMPASGRHG